MKDNTTKTEPIKMSKRIGSTTYEVNCYFNPEAKETATEKVWRMLKKDLQIPRKCDIIRMSQTVGLPERSSV